MTFTYQAKDLSFYYHKNNRLYLLIGLLYRFSQTQKSASLATEQKNIYVKNKAT